MSFCVGSSCISCREGSSASDISVFWPAVGAAHCCWPAGKCSQTYPRRHIRRRHRTVTGSRRPHSGCALYAAVPWLSSNALQPFNSDSVRHPSFMTEPKHRRSNIQRLPERARFLRSHHYQHNSPRPSFCCRPFSNLFLSGPHRSPAVPFSNQAQLTIIQTNIPSPSPQGWPIQNP